MVFVIRDVQDEDLPAILRITNHAIAHTDALWISTPFTLEQRQKWVSDRLVQGFPVFVAVSEDGDVCGYAPYGAFRAFEGYAKTIEHSAYVDVEHHGRGLGRMLLVRLTDHARQAGFYIMVAGIPACNWASFPPHRHFCF